MHPSAWPRGPADAPRVLPRTPAPDASPVRDAAGPAAAAAGADPSRRAPPSARRLAYRRGLAWAFAFFSSVRMLAYLPTIAAIWQTGDSSQHSLATWLTWFGANLTMALYLHEQEDGRTCKAVWVSAGNAAMCLATSVLIVAFR